MPVLKSSRHSQEAEVTHLPLIKQAEADGILPHANEPPRAIYGVQDPMLTLQVDIAALRIGPAYLFQSTPIYG